MDFLQKQRPVRTCIRWGLVALNQLSEVTVPLKSLDINIQIIHNTARVYYTQIYYNDSDLLVESEYFFPISSDCCFDSFEAKFNDTEIKGVIKEKEKAKEEYKEALRENRTAAYSEINEETGDIMKVLIGNIPPKTDVSITFSYIQKLETSLNKFWCFRLFSTITPRYKTNLSEALSAETSLLAIYPTVGQNSLKAYPWTIKAEIQSPSPIEFLKSPSHDIVTTYGNENHTCTVTFDPQKNYFPNKDFILLYTNGKEKENTDYVLTPFEDGYCAMVTLMADFEKTNRADAYENFVKAKKLENQHEMDTIKGEYIFLIDRSGSMQGNRIEMAKRALLVFLKSLPKDSYCNVVSFGSTFRFLHQQSVAYSKESLDSMSNKIQTFNADMNGTEIHSALKAVFDAPAKKGYPRFIFLLTDGAVSNTSQVLDLIKDNNDKARVFTIGVGNGCSQKLVTDSALYGLGKCEFVNDNQQIYEKVISLLNASLSPCYSDVSLQSNNFDAVVKAVSPNPATIPFMLNGESVTFFLLLREEAFDETQKMSLKLRMFDTRIGDYKTMEVTLNKEEAFTNELVPKLAIYDMMRRLEEAKAFSKDSKKTPGIKWNSKNLDIKTSLLELSLKHGILCQETAFFCAMKQHHNELNTYRVKVVIPTIKSVDYNEMARFRTGGGQVQQQLRKCSAAMPMKARIKMDTQSYLGGEKECESIRPTSSASLGLKKSESKTQRPQTASVKIQASSSSTKPSQENSQYLDIIMKQTFEGYWESNDQELVKVILKSAKLPEVPKDIHAKNDNLLNQAWITILVLLWLEVACRDQKGAWNLIHQKGSEWLKSQGVDYEQIKTLGGSLIKA